MSKYINVKLETVTGGMSGRPLNRTVRIKVDSDIAEIVDRQNIELLANDINKQCCSVLINKRNGVTVQKTGNNDRSFAKLITGIPYTCRHSVTGAGQYDFTRANFRI